MEPMDKAREALRAVRQYQEDWLDHGVDRVHLYFDDVEGNWLENFEEIMSQDTLDLAAKYQDYQVFDSRHVLSAVLREVGLGHIYGNLPSLERNSFVLCFLVFANIKSSFPEQTNVFIAYVERFQKEYGNAL